MPEVLRQFPWPRGHYSSEFGNGNDDTSFFPSKDLSYLQNLLLAHYLVQSPPHYLSLHRSQLQNSSTLSESSKHQFSRHHVIEAFLYKTNLHVSVHPSLGFQVLSCPSANTDNILLVPPIECSSGRLRPPQVKGMTQCSDSEHAATRRKERSRVRLTRPSVKSSVHGAHRAKRRSLLLSGPSHPDLPSGMLPQLPLWNSLEHSQALLFRL